MLFPNANTNCASDYFLISASKATTTIESEDTDNEAFLVVKDNVSATYAESTQCSSLSVDDHDTCPINLDSENRSCEERE